MERIDEVYEFYNGGAEIGRLERGLGVVEFWRSKEIISRYLNGKLKIYESAAASECMLTGSHLRAIK